MLEGTIGELKDRDSQQLCLSGEGVYKRSEGSFSLSQSLKTSALFEREHSLTYNN